MPQTPPGIIAFDSPYGIIYFRNALAYDGNYNGWVRDNHDHLKNNIHTISVDGKEWSVGEKSNKVGDTITSFEYDYEWMANTSIGYRVPVKYLSKFPPSSMDRGSQPGKEIKTTYTEVERDQFAIGFLKFSSDLSFEKLIELNGKDPEEVVQILLTDFKKKLPTPQTGIPQTKQNAKDKVDDLDVKFKYGDKVFCPLFPTLHYTYLCEVPYNRDSCYVTNYYNQGVNSVSIHQLSNLERDDNYVFNPNKSQPHEQGKGKENEHLIDVASAWIKADVDRFAFISPSQAYWLAKKIIGFVLSQPPEIVKALTKIRDYSRLHDWMDALDDVYELKRIARTALLSIIVPAKIGDTIIDIHGKTRLIHSEEGGGSHWGVDYREDDGGSILGEGGFVSCMPKEEVVKVIKSKP